MALVAHGVEYSSSSSRSNRRHRYDVFLSFRGEDTRGKFTDHLYDALCRNGLETFRDEEELERGEVIKPSLLQAIEESLSAVVVLSENYATSRWCLDELLKILHSQKELGLHIFPIFYGVDPSYVRHQRGSFGEAFKELEQKFAHDRICRWRGALKEVADLSGWDSQHYRHESKLIEDVVEKVMSKLYGQPPLNLNDEGLVGMGIKIAQIDSVIANESEEVKFIGIWGMGGLGKTTLARAVYERRKKNYAVHFFLPNVREKSATDVGLVELQQKLFSPPNRTINMEVGDCDEGRELIERRLSSRKVLLVLDDVSDISQLENLAGKKGWFGKGSKIILTTRDQHLLVQHRVDSQYKMNLLSHDESLQLFIQTAFKGEIPDNDYLELSEMVIQSANGLPLALKVFGSFLCGRSKLEWKNALKKIHSSDDRLFRILKVSFDGLGYNERNIFLDIACFFNGRYKNHVKQILENSGLHTDIGIVLLIEKSLVTEYKGRLWVHDTLQEMGEKIVFDESPDDAGQRSRIWSLEDTNHVLGNKRGTKAIRGIVLKFDKQYDIHLDPEAFSSTSNLKLLIISHFSQCQLKLHGLNCLSNTLKVIEWEGYPLDFLPSQTQFNELVDLKLQHSKLKELWKGAQFLKNLTFIDLSHSTNLIKTPNFDETPNLQSLILEGCTNLVEVHHSLGKHKNLGLVNFRSCKSIETLPIKFEMNCLTKFVLHGCSKVEKLPEFGEGMEHLSELELQETAISELPQSLVNLIGLSILNLEACENLVCLPSDFQKLKAIKEIITFGCSRFSRLPENLNENEALKELRVGQTAITEVPSCLNNLELLSLSGCKGLFSSSTKFLWSSPANLSSLVFLDLGFCDLDDESLPREIGNLSSLTSLYLCGNHFVEFPSGIILKLRKLEFINVDYCLKLQSLPQLPSNVSTILATDCPLLEHYLREQQLWEFIVQFDSQTPRQTAATLLDDGSTLYFLGDSKLSFTIKTWDAQVPTFFTQPTRVLIISGGEVPSWFHNQEYFCAEDFLHEDTPTNVSFRVNMHGSCELWGIAVCLVLEGGLKSENLLDVVTICWTYRVSNGEYSNSHRSEWICSQESCCYQRCIIYIRFSSFVVKNLQMVFFTKDIDEQQHLSSIKIKQCGWRVLYKEDVERWQNTRDEGCCSRKNNDHRLKKMRLCPM